MKVIITLTQKNKEHSREMQTDIKGKITPWMAETLINMGLEALGIKGQFMFRWKDFKPSKPYEKK